MAFSFRARPFMHRLSAACEAVSEWPRTRDEILYACGGQTIVSKGHQRTSSWEENTAKPVPVGLCCSGVRRVQKAMGRPPNWVNQLSSSD